MEILRTYEVKLQPTNSQRKQLEQYFYEAKVLYNYLLNCSNIFAVNSCKIKHPWKYDTDRNKIKVELTSLPAKLKQNVHRQIMNSIKSLSASKKSGNNVGHLKFKSEIRSIEIDNQSYQVHDENHIKLAGFGRKKIRCFGLNQFYSDFKKLRSAKLIRRDSYFYLKICVSREIPDHEPTGNNVGIDMGVESTITLSDGRKFNCKIEETDRLKRLQKALSRSLCLNGKQRTNNQKKLITKIHKEYQKMTNRKKDFVNKLIHELDTNFDHVVFQDESISGWRNLDSCKTTIQHSCLGTFKNKLVEKSAEQPERYLMLSKWIPTTQYCPSCGAKNKHGLEQRTYHCICGYMEDRDIHAAKNMLVFAGLSA